MSEARQLTEAPHTPACDAEYELLVGHNPVEEGVGPRICICRPTGRSWYARRLAAFDLETTTPDPETARIVQACVAHVGGGLATEFRTWLVDPGVEIPAEAAAIHGITTEKARAQGKPAHEAVPQIVEAIVAAVTAGEPLVIMNASYDLTVVDRECRRYGIDVTAREGAFVIDPFVLDKHVERYRKGSRKLDALCQIYGAKLEGAHDAAFDAIAAARVAYRIGQRHPEIGCADLAQLQELQRSWYREQAQGLDDYWRRIGDPRRVESFDWPVRPWRGP